MELAERVREDLVSSHFDPESQRSHAHIKTRVALALIALYDFTDNLLAPITAHAVFNASNLIMLLWQ